ncbi:hypothetical protein EMCRGX_G029956 [Ephydatia muelleri]
MSSIRFHPYSSTATHSRTSSAAIVTTCTPSISAATTSVVAVSTSTSSSAIRANGAIPPPLPSHPSTSSSAIRANGAIPPPLPSHPSTSSSAIRANGAIPPPLPSHPLSPTLGFICTALTSIKSSLEELRKEHSTHKDEFKEFVRASFSIESSAYKDDLLTEVGTLYCNTLTRLPDPNDVLVFGHKPCEMYLNLRSSEFVAKFMPMLKAVQEKVPGYLYHVALLRKYCRITPTSKNNTFKHFTQWLKDEFHGQQPTDEDFQNALLEEGLFGATSVATPPILYEQR